MNYLLDTNVISDFVKGHPQVMLRFKQTSPSRIRLSCITTFEIEFGLQLNSARAQKIATVLNSLLTTIEILDFTREDANTAATIRATLQQQGTPIGAYDVLLAGCALRRGYIFVTANTNEFARVHGLQLENWRV